MDWKELEEDVAERFREQEAIDAMALAKRIERAANDDTPFIEGCSTIVNNVLAFFGIVLLSWGAFGLIAWLLFG